MRFRKLLITDSKSSKLVQPGNASFDNPALFSKAAPVGRVSFGNEGPNLLRAQHRPMLLRIIGAVGVKPFGFSSWTPATVFNRRNARNQILKLSRIVAVGARQSKTKRNAFRIREDVVFAPDFLRSVGFGPVCAPQKRLEPSRCRPQRATN